MNRFLLTLTLSVLLAVMSIKAHAQYQFEYNGSIPVFKGGEEISLPWAGGLSYTQFSDIDIDFDGDMDLFMFDISSNNIRVFIHEVEGTNHFYKPLNRAKNYFPQNIIYRATMVDYDMDGRKDLWTYSLGGLKVYRNVGDVVNGIQWELMKETVYSDYAIGNQPLMVSAYDIPAIEDIDNDGDIDVLTFHIGGETVEYHQNQSMEIYGVPDSLIYEQKNECWGVFRESGTNNTIGLNDSAFPCAGGLISNPQKNIIPLSKSHAGSTLLAIDMNNSGVMDLILGDASFENLTLLMNGGTAPNTNSPMTSQDVSFPSNTVPVDLQIFPAAYYVDVDFDGVKDLVVGTNVRNVAENENSVWFYKNLGSNALPNFIFQATDLFQGEMIEHGTASLPIFFDVDGDGLDDLLVSNFHRYIPILDKESAVAYYQNTGTSTAPEFTLVDHDYLNLSQQGFGLRITPTFGDLDNDGDEDMVLGRESGRLTFIENIATGATASFDIAGAIDLEDNTSTIMDVGEYCSPQIFDLDKDGLLDIVTGNRVGKLSFFKNIGTLTSPIFELISDSLGQVDLSGTGFTGYSAPHFFRRNDTTYLFAGALDGFIHYFDDIDDNLTVGDSFNLVSGNYSNIDVEAYSFPCLNDIDNDGYIDLFVGQDLGGVFHLEDDPGGTSSVHDEVILTRLSIYPNPASTELTVNAQEAIIERIEVFSIDGRSIENVLVFSNKHVLTIDHLPSGIYTIKAELSSGSFGLKKFIKR